MHITAASPGAPGTVETDIAAILDRAVAYLEQHGWCQDALYDDGDNTVPACAVGALNVAIFGEPVNHIVAVGSRQLVQLYTTALAVADWLALDYEDENSVVDTLIDWNDDHRRTADQVLGTFRAVADEHRKATG